MTRLKILVSLVGVALAASLASCGDNSARCGEGTVESDGLCIPTGDVTCGQGTVLDETSGVCVTDPSACAEGTVLVDGTCVPEDDTLSADIEELTEPNDGFGEGDDIAGMFDLPAVGADGVVIHGCINPYRDLDADGPDIDWDMWLVTASGPSVVEIAADGVHGLNAGFVVIPVSPNLTAVAEAGWLRIGANLAGDTSQRQVFLPGAGTYALVMSDTRSIFFDGDPFNVDGPGSGTVESCYFTTISQVAAPAAIPVAADGTAAGNVDGDVIFHSYDPTEGDLVDIAHDIQSDAAAEGVVVMRNNTFFAYAEPAPFIGGLFNADNITFVVDPIYNYALTPRPYTLTPNALNTNQLPIDGTTLTITHDTATTGDWNTLDDLEWSWFDVGAGEVVHFDMTFGDEELGFAIVTAETGVITDVTGLLSGTGFLDGFTDWVRFIDAGRYYVVSFHADSAIGGTYPITSTVTRVVPTPLTHGTPLVAAPFSDLGATWHIYDQGTAFWLEQIGAGDGFPTAVSLDFYDATDFGIPDYDFGSRFFTDIDAEGGTVGRIDYPALAGANLVRVIDAVDGDADGSSTYDLEIDTRAFTDLGTASLTTPIASDGLAVTDDDGELFFVRGIPNHKLTITVTPNPAETSQVDLRIIRLDADENPIDGADDGLGNDPETVTFSVPPAGWVAFAVDDFDGGDRGFDLEITAADPCAGGTYLAQTPVGLFGAVGDEAITAVQTLPFAFSFYGTAVTSYYVSTNGFLSFGAPAANAYFSNSTLPAAAQPNGLLASYWDDLENVLICQVATPTTVELRFIGGNVFFGPQVDFTIEMHSDNSVTYRYGADHAATGSAATVGAENLTGTAANLFGFNAAGTTPAGSVRTFTPGAPPP